MAGSIDSGRRAMVDTNVVVYAYDLDDPTKHVTAQALIEQLSDQGRLVLSTQVCNEFCAAMMGADGHAPQPPYPAVEQHHKPWC